MTNYKFAKQASTNAPDAGKFAKRSFTFTQNPSGGNTLEIEWNSVTRTYTFVESPSAGGNAQSINHPATYSCQIGETISNTVENLISTIHSNVHDTTLGQDTTISTGSSGAQLVVYSNAKIDGDIDFTATGFTGTIGTSIAGEDATFEPGGPYSALISTSTITRVLVRDDSAGVDGYNAGPPVNQLKVESVTLPANTVIPLQTWGATANNQSHITFLK